MAVNGIVFTPPYSLPSTVPIVNPDDKMLAPGSLFLYDTAHGMRPMISADTPGTPGTTIPTTGTAIVNLADSLKASVGLGSSDVNGSIVYTTDFAATGNSTGKSERSARGGVHVIVSQTGAPPAANRYFTIKMASAIIAYIVANPSHSYYWSVWRRVTRSVPTSATGGNVYSGIASASPYGSNPTLFALKQPFTTDVGGDVPTSSGPRLGEYRSDPTSATSYTGPSFAAIASQGWTTNGGTPSVPTSTNDNGGRSIATWGACDPFTRLQNTVAPSWVFYRGYCEDLTVSGRTFAQVQTLDYGRYTADVLTAGGKFYADTTPTAPTSIP